MPRIVDLTLPVVSGMAGIPSIPFYEKYPVKVQAVTVVSDEQRAVLACEGIDLIADAPARGSMNTVLTLNTHIGTHIDAPRHFYADGHAIDHWPLDRLVMRDALVLDVSHKPDGAGVTADDLERTGVKPAAGQAAVIKTLWTDRAWGKPECFPEKPFWRMELSPAERGANHKRWLKAGIPMVQLLTNLDRIGPRFSLIALPLRLTGMDGAPARVVGVEE
jgi:arylformamidase